VVEGVSEALPYSGQHALVMALVGPTQCEAQWHSVLASFDKQHKTLIANNPDATQERNLVLTLLVKIGESFSDLSAAEWQHRQLETADQQSAENENILCKHLDGKALFTGMLLLRSNTQEVERQSPVGVCSSAVCGCGTDWLLSQRIGVIV
jgi:hypothetical protein